MIPFLGKPAQIMTIKSLKSLTDGDFTPELYQFRWNTGVHIVNRIAWLMQHRQAHNLEKK